MKKNLKIENFQWKFIGNLGFDRKIDYVYELLGQR